MQERMVTNMENNDKSQTKADIEVGVPGPAVEFNSDGSIATTALPSEEASAPAEDKPKEGFLAKVAAFMSPEVAEAQQLVNHVQTDEFYELPRVSNTPAVPKESPVAVEPAISAVTVDLSEHKTGKPSNTTAGQLDLAIDRFHKLQDEAVAEPDNVAAKLDLLGRMEVLAQEADQYVKDKIALIKASL